jgi:hypothetical protein
MKILLAILLCGFSALAQTAVVRVSGSPVNGDCANWVVSGGVARAGDAGLPCSSSAGGGGLTIYSGSTVAYTGTMYFPVGGGASASSTEANVRTASSSAATISNMYVQLSAALGVGNSVVFTWRLGGVSQTLTCTISGASATSCNDTTHSFNVTAGGLVDIQAVVTGTVVVTPTTIIGTAFGTSSVGITSVFGNAGPTVGATGDINATGQVVGINSVPLCTGFTPTNGQNLQFTTASSPNPCYTAAAGGGGGGTTWNAPQSIGTTVTCSSSVFFQPFNDSIFFPYAFCNGSSALSYYFGGQAVTPIGAAGGTYAWTNQGSATVAQQTNGIWTFDFPQHGATSNQLNVFDAAIPTAPSSQTFRLIPGLYNSSAGGNVGVSVRESATGKLITATIQPIGDTGDCGANSSPCAWVGLWNSTSSFSGNPAKLAISTFQNVMTLKVAVASGITGNITISFSQDGGASYTQIYSAAKNAFFTIAPDRIGFYGNNNLSGNPDIFMTAVSLN